MENNVRVPRMETISKAAEISGLPVHFIRTAVANGDIVAIRAGRKFLVNVDSLIAFLSTGVSQGAACREAAPQSETAPRIAPITLR